VGRDIRLQNRSGHRVLLLVFASLRSHYIYRPNAKTTSVDSGGQWPTERFDVLQIARQRCYYRRRQCFRMCSGNYSLSHRITVWM